MLINQEFTSLIKQTGVDDFFIDALSEAYENFSKQIMMELTLFKYNGSEFGFSDLGLVSREYAVQKYFEPRIETYIRQYLITNFFEKIFEERDYLVDTPTYYIPDDKYIDGEIFCSNKEFEKNCGFEFVLHNETVNVGFRTTDILSWDAEKYFSTGLISQIIIIDWNNIDGISDKEKSSRLYGIKGNIDILGIRQFLSIWLGEAECKAYELFIRETVRRYQETIGISSLPKLTAPILFSLRLEEERNVLKSTISDLFRFASIDRGQQASPPDNSFDTHYGYKIIDINNYRDRRDIRRSQTIEEDSKKLLIDAGVLQTFSDRKLYKVLVGKSDCAKSFLTSEYLYSQYNESDLFDYTAIVSGYLKSIEQLLSTVVYNYADLGYRIKSNNRTDSNGRHPASSRPEGRIYKIDLTTQEFEYADTTIGSLIHFVEDYQDQILRVNDPFKQTVIDCLECYRIECRNDSFHIHNNYDWERVEKIRHNTIVLYAILLGAFKFGSDQDVQNRFSIISDDRLERIYYWLRKKQMYAFRIKFKDDPAYYLATRAAEGSFPVYDNDGLLQNDFTIELKCSKESEKTSTIDYTISRTSIPEEVWYSTYVESYPVDISL